jgi:hypothetical protein
MPQEQIYQPQIVPGNTAGIPLAQPQDFGAGVGQGIGQLGGALEQGKKIDRQLRADEQATTAASNLARVRLALDEQRNAARANAAPLAAGHAQAMADSFDAATQDITAGITDTRVRRSIEAQIQEQRASFVGNEDAWQVATAAKESVGNIRETGNRWSAFVRTSADPDAYVTATKAIDGLVDSQQGIGEYREPVRRELHAQLAMAAGQRLQDTNPKALVVALDSGHFNDVLDGQQIDRLRDGAQVEVRRLDALAAHQAVLAVQQQKEFETTALGDGGRGVAVDPGSLRDMAKIAKARGDTSRAAELDAAAAASEESRVYGATAPAQVTTRIAQIEGHKDWQASPDLVARHTQLLKLREQLRTAEPEFPPLNFDDPAAVTARVQQSNVWAQGHNGTRRILGHDQAAELAGFASGGPAARAQVAGMLAKLPGDAAMIAANEVSKHDFALRQAILLPPALRVQLFEGEKLASANPTLKPASDIRERWNGHAMLALKGFPADAQNAVLAGAANVYAYRAAQRGLTDFDQKLWDGTVNEMLDPSGKGGIGVWNRTPILLPRGMPQREMEARMYNLPSDHLGAFYADHKTRIPKDVLLSRYTPVPTERDGVYRFVDANGRFAFGRHGVAELDVRKAPLPVIRVPMAGPDKTAGYGVPAWPIADPVKIDPRYGQAGEGAGIGDAARRKPHP